MISLDYLILDSTQIMSLILDPNLKFFKRKYHLTTRIPIWYASSNTCFQFLNNITHIFIHFFIHTYFKKLQTIILKLFYQTKFSPVSSILLWPTSYKFLATCCLNNFSKCNHVSFC